MSVSSCSIASRRRSEALIEGPRFTEDHLRRPSVHAEHRLEHLGGALLGARGELELGGRASKLLACETEDRIAIGGRERIPEAAALVVGAKIGDLDREDARARNG